VNTLIIVVARNIRNYLPEQGKWLCRRKSNGVSGYIQNNAFPSSWKIRTETVSKHFGYFKTYHRALFKSIWMRPYGNIRSTSGTKFIVDRLQHNWYALMGLLSGLGFFTWMKSTWISSSKSKKDSAQAVKSLILGMLEFQHASSNYYWFYKRPRIAPKVHPTTEANRTFTKLFNDGKQL